MFLWVINLHYIHPPLPHICHLHHHQVPFAQVRGKSHILKDKWKLGEWGELTFNAPLVCIWHVAYILSFNPHDKPEVGVINLNFWVRKQAFRNVDVTRVPKHLSGITSFYMSFQLPRLCFVYHNTEAEQCSLGLVSKPCPLWRPMNSLSDDCYQPCFF